MEAQIIQYIEQILQREPLPGEVESWVTFVDTGVMTLAGVQRRGGERRLPRDPRLPGRLRPRAG